MEAIDAINCKLQAIMQLFGLDMQLNNNLTCQLLDDARAYVQKDPTCNGNILVAINKISFQAIISYRLAHDLYSLHELLAVKISELSKTLTSIEIHPCAQIGKSFVLDHGIGRLQLLVMTATY